jgi:DNA-binding NarL/FixJ family response regulator
MAAEQLEQALQFARQTHSLFPLRLQSALLALACIRLDNMAQAEALLEAFGPAHTPNASTGWTMAQRLGWYVRAELALKRRQLDEALSIVDRLIESLETSHETAPSQEWDVVPRLLVLRGAILAELQRAGRPIEHAEAILHHACAVASKHEARTSLWQIQLQLGRLYQAQARRSEALAAFAATWQSVEALVATIPDPGLRDAYLRRVRVLVPQPTTPTPRRATQKAYDGLTEREREVADLIARGKSNREIAEMLVMTERTTKAHVGHTLGKLGFNSRTQIVAWAIDKGLGSRSQE